MGRGLVPRGRYSVSVTGSSAPGAPSFSTPRRGARTDGPQTTTRTNNTGDKRNFSPRSKGGGDGEGRPGPFRENAEMADVSFAKPSALGGSGGNNRPPPMISPKGYGSGGPRGIRSAVKTWKAVSTDLPNKAPPKRYPWGISLPSLGRGIRGKGGKGRSENEQTKTPQNSALEHDQVKCTKTFSWRDKKLAYHRNLHAKVHLWNLNPPKTNRKTILATPGKITHSSAPMKIL